MNAREADLAAVLQKRLEEVADQLRKRLLILTVAVGLLLAVVGVGAFVVLRQGQLAHNALCSFRADLVTRIAQGQDFLDHHPEGFKGISAAQIQVQLDNQRRTVASLDSAGLNCG